MITELTFVVCEWADALLSSSIVAPTCKDNKISDYVINPGTKLLDNNGQTMGFTSPSPGKLTRPSSCLEYSPWKGIVECV